MCECDLTNIIFIVHIYAGANATCTLPAKHAAPAGALGTQAHFAGIS